jgi:DNA topoisomerase-2
MALTGEMMLSELYVHGDASANNLISLMAAPYCNNVPLLEGKGTFGTRVAPVEGIGAPRYVSVKRYAATDKLIYQDLDVVPLKDNHDGSNKEPVTFLPIIPTVLLNGVAGIAVGWATSILPRNLDVLVDATLKALDGKKIKQIPVSYDYLDIGVKYLGDNSWEFSGKVDIIDTSTVCITELPPDLSLKKFKDFLVTLEDGDLVNDWTDRSTKSINIEVKFKRGSIKDWTEETAIDFFKLTKRKKENIVVIDWSGEAIRQYDNAEDLVVDFVKWRFDWYIERYRKLLADTQNDLNFWEAVKLCFDKKLPSKLTSMADRKELSAEIATITQKVGLNDSQIERIVNFASYRWTQESYQNCLDNIEELKNKKREYNDLLKHPEKIKQIFRDEVSTLKNARLR